MSLMVVILYVKLKSRKDWENKQLCVDEVKGSRERGRLTAGKRLPLTRSKEKEGRYRQLARYIDDCLLRFPVLILCDFSCRGTVRR